MTIGQETNRPPIDDAYGEFSDTTTTTIKLTKEPQFFRRRPSGVNGVTCADLQDEPCSDCDGTKCVYAYINSCK